MQPDVQLLALFCGHFLGDFIFQTDRLVALKSEKKKWIAFHVALVSLLTWLFLGNLSAWWVVLSLFFLHLAVDSGKIFLCRRYPGGLRNLIYNGTKEEEREEWIDADPNAKGVDFFWFIFDQSLHILTIVLLWYGSSIVSADQFRYNHWESLLGGSYGHGLLLLTGLAVVTSGVGIALKFQMAEFAIGLENSVRQGLPRGGKTIGMLERLLVFMFVLAGKPEGVGFVIAAKSVFRIGELTNKQDREHAEYIMIGTLRSFTYALAIAFIVKWLMERV